MRGFVFWVVFSTLILLFSPICVKAGDPTVEVNIVGPSPEVTVNTGADSTVSVNGSGLATSGMLFERTSGLSYDDTWLRRCIPIIENRISVYRSELDLLTDALAKDIALDHAQDAALREIIREMTVTNEQDTAQFLVMANDIGNHQAEIYALRVRLNTLTQVDSDIDRQINELQMENLRLEGVVDRLLYWLVSVGAFSFISVLMLSIGYCLKRW